jgi:membrane protease subunit (stomatin/prohibitin family)
VARDFYPAPRLDSSQGSTLDANKNQGAMVVMIPVAVMAVVINERMVMVMLVDPAFVVMIVVGKGFASTGDNESGGKSEEKDRFFGIFHGYGLGTGWIRR